MGRDRHTRVLVPTIIGSTIAAAKAALAGAGLQVRFEEMAVAKPAGIVYKQSPRAGSRVGSGSTVTAYVAKGAVPPPPPPPLPPPVVPPVVPPVTPPPLPPSPASPFALRAGSPCINAGVAVPGIPWPALGTPDMGAFEKA